MGKTLRTKRRTTRQAVTTPRIIRRPENPENCKNFQSNFRDTIHINIKDFQKKQEETEKELEKLSIELQNRQQIIGGLIDQENTNRMRLKRSISETAIKKKLQNMEDIITNHKTTMGDLVEDVTQNHTLLTPHEDPKLHSYLRLEEEDPTIPIVPRLPMIPEKKKTRTFKSPKQTLKQKAEGKRLEVIRKEEERRKRIRGKKS